VGVWRRGPKPYSARHGSMLVGEDMAEDGEDKAEDGEDMAEEQDDVPDGVTGFPRLDMFRKRGRMSR
jgi:hypothetical protein